MEIKDIINYNLITSDINSTIQDISKLMKDNDIGFIPITQNKKIIGVVTDRDIVIRGLATDSTNLNSIISTNIITIDCNNSIENALDYFGKYKTKRLLVKENNKIIGVLSISDILKKGLNCPKLLKTIATIFSTDIENNNVEIDSFYL